MKRLLVAALFSLIAIPAGAHDEAQWIADNGSYRDRNNVHCCGPKDCSRVPKGAVIQVGNEWHVVGTKRVFKPGDPDLYRSAVDFDLWWCVREGEVKCLFEPPGGM